VDLRSGSGIIAVRALAPMSTAVVTDLINRKYVLIMMYGYQKG